MARSARRRPRVRTDDNGTLLAVIRIVTLALTLAAAISCSIVFC